MDRQDYLDRSLRPPPFPTSAQYHPRQSLPPVSALLELAVPTHTPVPPGQPTQRKDRRTYSTYRLGYEPSEIYYYEPLGIDVRTYYIENMPFTMEAPANEDTNTFSRRTVDGRTLTYRLTVLQQPERARACGAGARSSADRRPVDPPPVVELRVFEGDSVDDHTDITLKHNATFILCASLENARPIAHGRMHTPPTIASLQGVNFAGTNYLDRPNPAGYFIFPDLSVRNEGWYRLSFSLFEGAKEANDADPERSFPSEPQGQEGGEPRKPLPYEEMAMRLDVRSKPFQVFSAKKFPGLSESTELSRLVADQGCRVRIRRDVRMRKHGERRKEEAESEGRRSADRFATPDTAYHPQTPLDRPRSISRASMDGSQHSVDQYRRPSVDSSYYGGMQYHPGQAPAGPSAAASYHPPIAATPSTHAYQGYTPASAALPPLAMSNGFTIPEPRRVHDGLSAAYQAPEPRNIWHSSPVTSTFPRSMTPDTARPVDPPRTSVSLVPDTRRPSVTRLPSVSSIHNFNNPASGSSGYDNGRKQYDMPQPAAAKRSYSPASAFTQAQALKRGMRPDSVQNINKVVGGSMEADPRPYNSDSDDNFEDQETMIMKYRRANGALGRKSVPNQQTQA